MKPNPWTLVLLLALAAAGHGQPPLDSVPTTRYRVPDLSRPAEILVDTWGVPYLYAETMWARGTTLWP